MPSDPMLALRIDDVPEWPDARQVENLAQALGEHRAKGTPATCSGWLRDWEVVQRAIKNPLADFGYPGGNLGGRFLDSALTWVEERYPRVRFVGMSDFVDLAQD